MKFTPQRKKKLLDLLREGYTQVAATGAVGITMETLHEWRRRGKEAGPDVKDPKEKSYYKFYHDFEVALNQGTEPHERMLVDSDDWRAHKALLSMRNPKTHGGEAQLIERAEAVSERTRVVAEAALKFIKADADRQGFLDELGQIARGS